MHTLIALLLSVAPASPYEPDYTTAYNRSVTENKPLIVVVGTTWCPYCPQAKRLVGDVVTRHYRDQVVLVYLDYDRDRKLAEQAKKYATLPEVIVFPRGRCGIHVAAGDITAKSIHEAVTTALQVPHGND